MYNLLECDSSLNELKPLCDLCMMTTVTDLGHTLAKFTLSIDRRTDLRDQILSEVETLHETIAGLGFRVFDSNPDDGGKYRDFAPAAELEHQERDALYAVVEELVDMFGWAIDVSGDE